MDPDSRSGDFGVHQARFWSVVSEESEHVGFFRFVILLENANETMFECLARSAFPTLDWADGVWCGLGHFSRPYIEVWDELVRYLGGLSDHGTTCLHKYLAGDHSQSPNVFGARIDRATSDEIFEMLRLGTVKLTNLWTYSAPWTRHKLLILSSSSDRFRLQTQSILLNLTVPVICTRTPSETNSEPYRIGGSRSVSGRGNLLGLRLNS